MIGDRRKGLGAYAQKCLEIFFECLYFTIISFVYQTHRIHFVFTLQKNAASFDCSIAVNMLIVSLRIKNTKHPKQTWPHSLLLDALFHLMPQSGLLRSTYKPSDLPAGRLTSSRVVSPVPFVIRKISPSGHIRVAAGHIVRTDQTAEKSGCGIWPRHVAIWFGAKGKKYFFEQYVPFYSQVESFSRNELIWFWGG